MKLAHKNFLYTTIITGILTVLVLGYFILMLPSLYVDHLSRKNYEAIVAQHTTYLKDRSYQNIKINNPSCISVEIPFDKEGISISGKAFEVEIMPATNQMQYLVESIKDYIKQQLNMMKEGNESESDFSAELEEKLTEWKDSFLEQTAQIDNMPFSMKLQSHAFYEENFTSERNKLYFYADDTIIVEAGASDGVNQYTNYLAFTCDKDELVISYLPAMTPQMNEIVPIVIHSLPMMIAVIILFALIVSYLYSIGMVSPVIKLVKHTKAVKASGIAHYTSLIVSGKDEISELSRTLNELYEELKQNYLILENKNKELAEKNKRQEVFLKSSSHQLKTPIAATLLLVDGMINRVGKYQDVQTYLPQVKKQLLSMQKMVQDILYLTHCEENLYKENFQLSKLVTQSLAMHEVSLTVGNFKVITDFTEECNLTTDSSILMAILDNLISNAIVHSKEGATITITTKQNQLFIQNNLSHIPEELLPNIFEPFVSNNGKGHGLGLYIIAYYAEILGADVKIDNVEDGVLTRIIFY